MGICRWLGRKEEVSLFDNGLRIESSLHIVCNEKWQSRYVVCQRRCLSEAPLIGIFKNGSTRAKGEHLELFYLQNYIGYEYGFKYKRSNKTLAILVQGQTLIFSFNNVESMVFWKEWLKDVCGRSAMYFVRVHTAPKNSAVIRLSSRSARIHITRYALVIVQEVPPKQRLYLNLEDLSEVECVQNKFAFCALAYPWEHPQSFVFTSDQIPELSAKLQCLLKAKQYFSQQSSQASRLPSLKNGSLGQASAGHQQQQLFSLSPLYANDGRQTPTPLFSSLYANDELRRSSNTSFAEDGPPPLKKESVDEGPYAMPIDLGSEGGIDFAEDMQEMQAGPVRSRGGSHNRIFDDFHFIEGTPAQFLNQQLVSSDTMSGLGPFETEAPPGLVKPADGKFPSLNGQKFGKSLSRKLKRQLTGSYSKYDGDKSSVSYPKEASSAGSGRRVRPKKSVTPVRDLLIAKMPKPIAEELPSAANSPPVLRPPERPPYAATRAPRDESFDSSVSSSVRIDSAVQKGRERLRMCDRRSSTNSASTASRRNSSLNNSGDSANSSSNDLSVIANMDGPPADEGDGKGRAPEEETVDREAEERWANPKRECCALVVTRSLSVSTLETSSKAGGAEGHTAYSGSVATTVHSLDTPLAISLDELRDPSFMIKDASAMSLSLRAEGHVASCARSDGEEGGDSSSRSLSVCSELNARVMFQRGGRNQASQRSNKVPNEGILGQGPQHKGMPVPPSLPPPPLPPRKQSSQPNFKKAWLASNDDYADIDELMAGGGAENEYVNREPVPPSFFQRPTPSCDYVRICPVATSALRETKHGIGPCLSPIKRSNSLYDFLDNEQHYEPKKQSSEAEYYAVNWDPEPGFPPRQLAALSKARQNLSSNSGSTSRK